MFEWQFQTESNEGNANVICGWDKKKLLGICGYVPLKVSWGDLSKPLKATWAINWIVREKAPLGLGLLLFKEIYKKYKFILTCGVSKDGANFYKALGGVFCKRIPRYIYVLNKKVSANMLNPDAFKKDFGSFNLISDQKSFISIKKLSSEKLYQPNWNFYPELRYGTVRTFDYLYWRYINHPVFNYYIFIKGGPKKPSVCVYRIEESFGYYNAKVGRIVEFYHPNDSKGKLDGLMLMNFILNKMKEDECAYADFICTNKTYKETIIECGWHIEPKDLQILPVRLTPIERSIRHQNMAILADKSFPIPEFDEMYITKSDADEDIPTSL